MVDTGLHALDWQQEEAVQYMLNHTAASEESLRNEVTRYITWPGQATAYKVGQLRLLQLRREAEQKLGHEFDIRDFHQVVLQSAGPLNILEEQVHNYIYPPPSAAVGLTLANMLILFCSLIRFL